MDKELLEAIINQAIEVGRLDEQHNDVCDALGEQRAMLDHLVTHVNFDDKVIN